jgi:hypothetical protein
VNLKVTHPVTNAGLPGFIFLGFILSQELFICFGFINCVKISVHPHPHPQIQKEAIHDSDLELFAIQKARELDWDNFKASDSFIKLFKKENRISSRRYNKLVTRVSSTRNICSLEGM